MRRITLACLLGTFSATACANDWERFYRAEQPGSIPILPSYQPPKTVDLPAEPRELVDSMWRRGFAVMGGSSFNSSNASTKDAIRFATKIHAAYVGITTQVTSSQTLNMPMTTPTTGTSYTSGNLSVTGLGGYATGSYSGSTATYGSQTHYIPITVNRFDKAALYFGPLARQGTGLLFRAPTPEEVSKADSRHLLIVRAVRDGSPADTANILEGDTVMTVNGGGATLESFRASVESASPIVLHLMRNGQPRDVTIAPVRSLGSPGH